MKAKLFLLFIVTLGFSCASMKNVQPAIDIGEVEFKVMPNILKNSNDFYLVYPDLSTFETAPLSNI